MRKSEEPMPRKVDVNSGHTKKWNLYVNEIEKLEYLKALVASGFANAQSAAVRAFMFLYATDEETRKKVNELIPDYLVYNKDGSTSQM